MKAIITEEDWDNWKQDIHIDYVRDNHFTELKDAEILQNKLQTLDNMQQYVGEYFSKEWVMKNVLYLDDDAIEDMKKQIDDEEKSGEIPTEDEQQQQESIIHLKNRS